jgi:translation initiation factor IF-3
LFKRAEDPTISEVIKPSDARFRGKDVRLIDENNNQVGIVSFKDAFERSEEVGMDLVLIADQVEPAVVRIMNYGKFLYQKKKHDREQRRKQATHKNKEIKFRANIDPHDFQLKCKHIVEFLEKGHRVKVSLFFRGREMAHREVGLELLQKVAEELGEVAQVDQRPQLSGRTCTMLVSPSKGKKS